MNIRLPTLVGLALVLAPAQAHSHAFLTPSEAVPAVPVVLAIGIDHACADEPTTNLRVRIPEGFVTILPLPKEGWEISVVEDRYQQPQALGAIELRAGVTELQWTGGSLAPGFYDEFRFRGQLADNVQPGAVLYFPVIQTCAEGSVHRWIALPEEGQAAPEEPAPGLTAAPGQGA